ncbi:tyrosine-protein phosphatase non-receptor type 12-like [Bacillus rossius redtenbacheri]|uniref:tyrosine-protein phosphatase non-receptor type 12-like n=1 Tax=Bacillus rossius redtenbacheri TaxID=93214 RepID=UPI002FDDA156
MKEKQAKTPLKISLQNFLNHVEHLESQRNEDTYEKEFQELKNFSEKLKTLKGYSCSVGENEVNRKKNRYKDILPFDSSRVKLTEYVGVPGSNYINANFIRGASGSPAYIASQGPLPHTVNDFWRMVVEWDVHVIVMACSVEEAGKHKCEKYWVENEEEKQFGNVSVQLVNACIVCPDYLVRTLLIKYPTSDSDPSIVERKVCQYHYVAWPDHGVPSKVRPLVDMVRKVRETQVSETLPVLVHCSAGCGRTGTICAIDYVWGLLRSGRLTKDFSLFNLVRRMRKQRIAMVQTKEQYILVHQAVRELFCDQLRVIDSHPYENIDVNGLPLVKDEEEPTYDAVGGENTDEGLVAGVKFRQGSQDDMVLCACMPATSPRVRRHASIVLLRHSLIETSEGAVAPLSVWKNHKDDADVRRAHNHYAERKEDDMVYTKVSSRCNGKSHSAGNAQQRDDHLVQTRDDVQFARSQWLPPGDAERSARNVHNVKQGIHLKRQQYI